MAIGTLAVTAKVQIGIQAQNSITGPGLGSVACAPTVSKQFSYGTSAANAAVGGSDESATIVTTITASASVSIDLTSITDVMQTAAVSLARIKMLCLWLLTVADDAVNGSACSGVTIDGSVTNGLSGQSNSGWFNATGAAAKIDLPAGAMIFYALQSAAGIVIDGTHKLLKLTNLDSVVSAKVLTTSAGGST